METIGSHFPKSWDEVPTLKFQEILFEKEFRYCEKVFDEDFENNNEENIIILEDFVESLAEKMDRYYHFFMN